jgi:capsule polysaccharide export protein KpsC/LpsZ
VKEHPAQLREFDHYNYLGRDRSFYERLSRLPRVRFAPTNFDHFELLDGALLVASVNGTVGWEAVVRRKPTIVFGEAWYQNAPGVCRIKTDTDCAAAIERILQNEVRIDNEMIDRFLDEFLGCCEYLCTTEDDARVAGIPFDMKQNVEIAKEAIAARLGQRADGKVDV